MLAVPNIPDMSVPDGTSDADNVEVRKWGDIPTFSFTPLDHIELMEKSDMVDFERGTKTAGFRGYFLKMMEQCLSLLSGSMLCKSGKEKDLLRCLVPSLVKREALLGTGYLPQGEDDLYKDGNDYLGWNRRSCDYVLS
jgi:seryl-tRNA synthetase